MTLDKERLRVLAEAATGWSNCDKVWPHAEYDEISVLGAICEEGVQYPVAEIDADTYGDDGDSLKLAQFYAGANPAAVLALLSENAAKEKQLAAYATLVKSIEERQRLASDEHAKAIEARDSLQSERDANSILTTENAALAAEVERLRKDAGHAEPMTRFCPGCGSVGEVPKKYRDCCPDGGDSRVIPTNLANKCHDLFQGALQAAMADKGGVSES